ncbi:C40 family peptidase [Gordonia sp. VNK21]|uniref:C40 family peptidase n=1 Tax=Gordonia sp. VNK21 TaxID=3382483 RepID=UPI0038D457D2
MRRFSIIAALVAVLAVVAGVVTPPVAQAEPQQTAGSVLKRYKALSVKAEKTAEAMNKAQDEYDKQRKIVAASRKEAAAAAKRQKAAQAKMAGSQDKVDALVRASYRGARVNRMYALLVSDSPQRLLDNMTDLEVISRQAAADLKALRETADAAAAAEKKARDTGAKAAAAVKATEKTRGELQEQQGKLQLEAVTIRAVYKAMTGEELAALRGPRYSFDVKSVPKGTAPHLVAVQAALSRIGDPYVWGATGPHQFDCSGLMVWAYKQAGVGLPRTSQAQLGGGKPVARDDLRPGDLIIYYPDGHHVGMYVGDGYVIHASTFGVPVAVVPVDKGGPYNAARRY